MPLLAVTVLGPDRPGIIADVTGALAELGGNLEDSSMTLLRGHFAMTLVVTCDAVAPDVEARLGLLLGDLAVYVRPVADESDLPGVGTAYVLTVHGADRPGIVSSITRVVAEHGGNVTDLTTRLAGGLYVLAAEVDLPPDADAEVIARALTSVAQALGVGASLRPAETDVL